LSKGSIVLIDALVAFLIALFIGTAIIYLNTSKAAVDLEIAIEKEKLRSDFYIALFSDHFQKLLTDSGEISLYENFAISRVKPADGIFLKYFISDDGGITLFYIYRKA
jgi:hypothetical protein